MSRARGLCISSSFSCDGWSRFKGHDEWDSPPQVDINGYKVRSLDLVGEASTPLSRYKIWRCSMLALTLCKSSWCMWACGSLFSNICAKQQYLLTHRAPCSVGSTRRAAKARGARDNQQINVCGKPASPCLSHALRLLFHVPCTLLLECVAD